MSRRRLKRQVRIAAQGIGIGVAASLVLILGAIVAVRFVVGGHIGHKAPFGLAFFAVIFVLMVYRFVLMERRPRHHRRFVARSAVTELSKDEKAKSA